MYTFLICVLGCPLSLRQGLECLDRSRVSALLLKLATSLHGIFYGLSLFVFCIFLKNKHFYGY